MQYLLTEQEYNDLRASNYNNIRAKKDELQKLCTLIADTMPVSVEWLNGGEPAPWNCILSEETEWYCDRCPVRSICPSDDKEFSK